MKSTIEILRDLQRNGAGSLTQVITLATLLEDEQLMGSLASSACVSSAALTGAVDALESKGLVTRPPSTYDRRSIFIKIAEKGLALAGGLRPPSV